jgi:serine/threonine-protein kinase
LISSPVASEASWLFLLVLEQQRAATFGNTASANRTRDLPPGSVVLGRYTIQKVLGRGGMATVYMAKHQQTDRLVALKLLDPEFSRDPAYVERFRREAKAAGRIRSDHVVAIYDLDAEVGGSLVLVMEYLEGQSMQAALKAGRFPVQKAISFGRQMLEGLAAAHESGVIHRDLKPANLYIERTATGSEKVKLLDFGISKLADASQQELTRDGQTLGTVAYMAPEQIRGKASATDPRVDLYSAGVSLFIMLTGKRPIDAEDTVQLLAAVLEHPPMTLAQATGLPFPAPLEAFIAKALEKDPNRRFQTAIEMRDALVEAGKVIGYESTGPLSVPSSGSDPSGVVPRVPAKTQMGVGGAPPPPTAAKQTMMGMGGAPVPPPTVQRTAPVPAMASSFAPQTLPAPMPGPATIPSPMPGEAPIEHDPFGPMPGGLAPPPMPALAAPTIGLPQEPAPAAPAPKQSRAGLVILLSAVGLVALGGAGALAARSMNQRPSGNAVHVIGQSANSGASAAPSASNGSAQQATTNAANTNTNTNTNAQGPTANPAGDPAAQQPTQNAQQPPAQQIESNVPTNGAAQAPAQAPQGTPPEPQQQRTQQLLQGTQQLHEPPAQNTQSAGAQQRSAAPSGGSAGSTARQSTATSTSTGASESGTRTTRTTRAAPTAANPFDPPPVRQANPPTQTTRPVPNTATQTTTPRTNTRRHTGTTTVIPF